MKQLARMEAVQTLRTRDALAVLDLPDESPVADDRNGAADDPDAQAAAAGAA